MAAAARSRLDAGDVYDCADLVPLVLALARKTRP
ncbi:MAG: hypothetical protein V7603_4491 [Micromonosporaceae bacterium]